MEKLHLEAMPLDDLWNLHEKVGKLLSERIIAEKQQLEVRLRRLGRGHEADGHSSEKMKAKDGRPRRKYPKVFPKYQNPKAPFETWSGRGKQPRWLVLALKADGKIEEFEIPVAVRAKTKSAAGRNHRG